MKKESQHRFYALSVLGIVLIVMGIIVSNVGLFLSARHNEQYQWKVAEIYTHEEIYDVMQYEDSFYVCYQRGSCVNVYNMDGTFRWAVSTPALNRTEFSIDQGYLLIYDEYPEEDCYIYNAETGKHIRHGAYTISEEIDYSVPFNVPLNELKEEELCYDQYQVYCADGQGGATLLVDRPDWYRLINGIIPILLSFIGILLLLSSWSLHAIFELRSLSCIDKAKCSGRMFLWSKATVAAHLGYAVLIHFARWFVWLDFLYILIIPMVLHTIIYFVLLDKWKKKNSDTHPINLTMMLPQMQLITGQHFSYLPSYSPSSQCVYLSVYKWSFK